MGISSILYLDQRKEVRDMFITSFVFLASSIKEEEVGGKEFRDENTIKLNKRKR